jgi:uncharacterized phage protein (TIGR01671 family)
MYDNVRVGGGIPTTVPSWLSLNRGWVELWGSNDEGVIMQFTGLFDKNGKEIYEGDILVDDDPTDACRHRIVYYDDQAKFELETWEGDDNWSSGLFDYLADATQIKGRLDLFEVIGNIYENPELLEETK